MSVNLRKKELKDRISLYLDIYDKGKRYCEYLGLYLSKKTRTKEERTLNKEVMEEAEIIRLERLQTLKKRGLYYKPETLIELANRYLNGLTDSSKRQYRALILHLKQFMQTDDVNIAEVDVLFVRDFLSYLKQRHEIQTVSNYFSKLKALLNLALQQGIVISNVCKEVKFSGKQDSNKTFLTLDEIRLLVKTDCSHPIIKNAFLFACSTGIRHADICEIRPINVENGTLIITQKKTSKKVVIPLNKSALTILKSINVDAKGVYFDLPQVGYTNILLKEWIVKAGINKKVTFHVARHSFATNLLILKNDLFTVSKLMGHSSLQHTQTYLKTVQAIQDDAVKGLEF